MKRIALLLVGAVTLFGIVAATAPTSQPADDQAAPIYGIKIPPGYRDWKMIAVDQLSIAGKPDQLRAQLGNEIAIEAFKEGKVPFPDGASQNLFFLPRASQRSRFCLRALRALTGGDLANFA